MICVVFVLDCSLFVVRCLFCAANCLMCIVVYGLLLFSS